MLNITITEQTPHNMLRAIRAACNELLGETTAADLTGAGIPVPSEERASALLAEQSTLASAFDAAVEKTGDTVVAKMLIDGNTANIDYPADADAPETDSSGAEWNPELHASTKTKNADGTWKKRRGAGQNVAEIVEKQEQQLGIAQTPNLPPLPPTPPAPAAPLVTMNDIYALISGGKCVLNDVIAGAQAMGFADVGAFSRDATPEQRAQLLQELTA